MPSADALVTNRTDVALCVRAADCLPVLLADPGNGVIGAAHSGRAACTPVSSRQLWTRCASSEPSGITAVLGPYACGNC